MLIGYMVRSIGFSLKSQDYKEDSEDSFTSVPEELSVIGEEGTINISFKDKGEVHCISLVLTTEILEERKVVYTTSPPCMTEVSFYNLPPFYLMLYFTFNLVYVCPVILLLRSPSFLPVPRHYLLLVLL